MENINEIIIVISGLILVVFVYFHKRKSNKKDFYLANIYCQNCKHYLGKDVNKFKIKCELLGNLTPDETIVCNRYKYERKL